MASHPARYSADVRMQLNVNGSRLRIGQMGPDFLILDDTAAYPPGGAEIVMSIDGRERRWTVRLPDGISAKQATARIE